MKLKYPPLHLLSIFEAAARLESFKAASEELFITPSAVSHQVKALETHLRFALFQRKSRGVAINNAGRMYLKYIQQGLSQFEQGTKELTQRFSSPTLKISCFTTLASNMLIPQLGAFQAAHPDIEIRIEIGNKVSDLQYEDIDLAIRLGDGNWPKTIVHKLTDIQISAVCSPKFANEHKPHLLKDISHLPLIDFTYVDDAWLKWARSIGLNLKESKRSLSFNDYDSAVNAAAQGLGMALAMFPIENTPLSRGVIVTPFNEFMPYSKSLYAVYRPEDAERHDIKCFINWLKKSELIAHKGE
ncbi:LysR substrate-binding domain-containing protein [Pseudoalteromonas sp. H105]|jgi:LysR family glycine cleavage system transcriptional activator|uniref:LysR substrate-binding domain-containing protein n=1 Tax=Pseudoalteromonas sp. H105 TaxID=1348393 RepID=UPI000732034A|nr:LysR substrate-binding domain-containing protein [Pseudoalteromonas sp. H105]KTF16076.1 transcriptional regulator [Pseudoalteromonas sp. H105]